MNIQNPLVPFMFFINLKSWTYYRYSIFLDPSRCEVSLVNVVREKLLIHATLTTTVQIRRVYLSILRKLEACQYIKTNFMSLRVHLILRLGSYTLKVTILKCLVSTNCCNLEAIFNIDMIFHLYDEKYIISLIILLKLLLKIIFTIYY